MLVNKSRALGNPRQIGVCVYFGGGIRIHYWVNGWVWACVRRRLIIDSRFGA